MRVLVQTSEEALVRIYDLSGHCVFAGKVAGNASYEMAKGFYIVTVGTERCKVLVR